MASVNTLPCLFICALNFIAVANYIERRLIIVYFTFTTSKHEHRFVDAIQHPTRVLGDHSTNLAPFFAVSRLSA